MNLPAIIKDCLTGKDGQTYDPARVYLAAGVASFLALAFYTVFKTHTFDYQSFGIGFGAVLAAGGLGIKLKSHTEPDQT